MPSILYFIPRNKKYSQSEYRKAIFNGISLNLPIVRRALIELTVLATINLNNSVSVE